MKLEVVCYGFEDHRIKAEDQSVMFGFVVIARSESETRFSVHQRCDTDLFNLPPLFQFTASQLDEIIIANWKEQTNTSEELHAFLLRTVFCGLGSFRCGIQSTLDIEPCDLDSYIFSFRDQIDELLEEYRKQLEGYLEACTPRWNRSSNVPIESASIPRITRISPAVHH